MKGDHSPLFYWHEVMMDRENIERLLAAKLAEEDLFLVELTVAAEKGITVYVDGMENVSVKQCATVTRYLRDALGEAADDYEITVSSPGLDKPFRHPSQYVKNLEKSVEVTLDDGRKISGKLLNVSENGDIRMQEFSQKKSNNKAVKPALSDTITEIEFRHIKQTKKLVFI